MAGHQAGLPNTFKDRDDGGIEFFRRYERSFRAVDFLHHWGRSICVQGKENGALTFLCDMTASTPVKLLAQHGVEVFLLDDKEGARIEGEVVI